MGNILFGKSLKRIRQEHNESQTELSAILGVARSAISMYESGAREPAFEILEAIADHYNVNMSQLLGENEVTSSVARSSVKIPVLGRVVAGVPIEAIEDILDYEEITQEMAAHGEYFALQVYGDSMEPKFSEGDVVIVRKQETVESGDIAIVLVNGDEATVKKIKKMPEGILLIANNTAVYEPTFYSNQQIEELPVRIIGKVVELRAKF